MTGPATRDDIAALIEAIERMAESGKAAAADQTAIIREILESTRGGPVQQVTMPQASPHPQRPERLVSVMAVVTAVMAMVAGGATVAAILQGQRVTDLRADMHTERLSREAMDNWTAQEVTAIRSYITNGKLQPMQPRPQRQPEPQP